MAGKALVVDDSTSARAILAKQLTDQEIEVDTVDSGEAALEYLQNQHPDVIFMDHLLPGIDGFEALRAIKESPETCNIPVLMYTSKRGEVYLNQVRELGAAGVLPKGNKPIQVSKVLRSLRLITSSTTNNDEGDGDTSIGRRYTDDDLLLRDLHSRFSDLENKLDSLRQQNPNDGINFNKTQRKVSWTWVAAALAVASVTLGYELTRSTGRVENLQSQMQSQARQLTDLRDGIARDLLRLSHAVAGDAVLPITGNNVDLEALEWALNLDQWVSPGDKPLGDVRLATIDGLLRRLDKVGFRGVITLNVHSGDFCQSRDRDQWVLAKPGILVRQCGKVDSLLAGPESMQSAAFTRFLQSAPALNTGSMRVEIVNHENRQPLMAYPDDASSISADTWNGIAALNNRVEITLQPRN